MKNAPKKVVDSPAVNKLRDAIENEAKWIYYLTVEGLENGLAPDFAREAMYELGQHYARNDYAGCDAPDRLGEGLMNRALRKGRGYVLETGEVKLEGTGQELLANPDVKRAYLGI